MLKDPPTFITRAFFNTFPFSPKFLQSIAKRTEDDAVLSVRTEDGALIETQASECCLQNERDDTVDDLVRSDFLHEPGILHTLGVRYGMDSIYTYSGQILIAANPHKRLPYIYGPRMMAQYRGVALGELSPHVYAIAEAAYAAMLADEQRQAILISGESGAGKTESAKMVMQYLAHRAGPTVSAVASRGKQSSSSNGTTIGGAVSAPIEEQVLESNPLLEAFGNAKTARNDNSSRFGKFVEIDFDAGGRVTGASIATYLLERSRVVSIRSPERSFHIFYQLCAGADEEMRSELHLHGGATGFQTLSQSDVFELEDVDDAEAFKHTLDAMRIVGLSDTNIKSILRCVAAILHLGNVVFEGSSGDEAVASSTPKATDALNTAAALLGVSSDALLTALTTRAIETRGERIVKTLDAIAAAESRDAFAKSLYSRLFDWLVAAVNRKIGAIGGGGRTSRSIGILDIYGFECFDRNSFEQLCINLANEKLQQAFNAHVFKGEQAEYAEEGIAWSYVDFVDNQDVLDLLEGCVAAGAGARSTSTQQGVFPLIDEACRLPRATHQDLAHALRTRLASHPRFGIPRRDQHAFAVQHYAGEVCYSTDALLDKNRDFVVAEHAGLMSKSAAALLQELFGAEKTLEGSGGSGQFDDQGKRRSAFMLSTVGSRFRRQLGGLMNTLGECQPHFIRCIKPNSASLPGSLAPPYVLEQLRAGGVLEAVRIACAGFPTRKPFLPFAQRFASLLGASKLQELGLPRTSTGFVDWYAASEGQIAEVVKRIMKISGIDGWQMGHTRVFLRAGQLAQLEGSRGRLLAIAAVKVQAAWRALEARRQLARARDAAKRIQKAWRDYVEAKEAARLKREAAAVRVQAAWKRHAARKAYIHHKRTTKAILIQSNWRRYVARSKFLEETEAGRRAAAKAEEDARLAASATTIQSSWRRVLAQRQVAVLRRQAKRVQDLQLERDTLAAERAAMAAALAAAEARATTAEADIAAKAARISTLESEVAELSAEVESSNAKVTAALSASAAGATAVEAAAASRAAELDGAHKRAAAALREEVEVAKRQRSEADERAAVAEGKLAQVQAELDSMRAELARSAVLLEERDGEIAAAKDLADQMKREKEALRASSQAATIAAAAAAATALKQAEDRGAAAAAAASSSAATEIKTLKIQLADAESKALRNSTALRDAQEKSSQLAARVEALSSRTERLEADSHAAADRENALLQELENTRRAAAARVRTPSPLAMAQSPVSTPLRRTIAQELDAAANDIGAASRSGGIPTNESAAAQSASMMALTEAVVFQRLPFVDAWSGFSGTLAIPQAAWLLHRCLLQWARQWRASEVAAAAFHIESSIAAAAIADRGLSCSGYWLAASLATGALLKMRVVGKPDLQQLFKLADSFIGLTDLHVALGGVIAEEIPVNIALLLSEEAKKCARRRSVTGRPALAQMATNGSNTSTSATTSPTICLPSGAAIPVTPSSPADVELAHMGSAERHWRALLGGIANVVEVLRTQGVPAAAVRAVVWATLRYIDGELLNALLLRRDCCSVSAAKALLTGLTAMQDVSSFVGAEWGCEPEEAARALDRSSQAARYLVQGKDDCARKALRNINVLQDLTRQCPSLTLQQVHRLTEHQHDDWLAGTGASMGSQTLVLLEMLRRFMNENRARLGFGGVNQPPTAVATADNAAAPAAEGTTPSRWVPFGEEESAATGTGAGVGSTLPELDEEDLLVDSSAPFAMFRAPFPVTRRLLTEAARSFVVAPGPGTNAANTSSISTPGPRLPNGSLPQLSPSKTTSPASGQGSPAVSAAATQPRSPAPSGLSLLDAIDQRCAKAGIPEALLANPNFSFLN
jgi:myosin-5